MKYFSLFFVLICTIDLVFIDVYPIGRLVSKPLIASSLLAYYIISLEKQHSFIILGLVFSILGDVFLLFTGDTVFKLGLLSFFVMQLCYINYLRKFVTKHKRPAQKIIVGILLLVTIGFNVIMYMHGVDIWWLIMIYSIVLFTMARMAILFPSAKNISSIGVGAILFVSSDLLLAVNKFLTPIVFADYLVMVLYCIAQYLIISGITMDAVAYFKSRKNSVN